MEGSRRWAGALLKLQIYCGTSNAHNGEDFCVILKFTGKYPAYLKVSIILKNSLLPVRLLVFDNTNS